MKRTQNAAKKPKKRRGYTPAQERELWARAGGRCEFSGCHRLLYRSSLTQDSVNLGEKAHIYALSPSGPRGSARFRPAPPQINASVNLMLLCGACHTKIDAAGAERK
ncbi:MAG: HNH endonuclease, partial [Fimbriimonadales bacterium]